jgi:transketolase C-terminal domain/subunit
VKTTYREVLREALRDALRRDERVFLMGEDVGCYGGCFAVSLGLLEEFGPERIRDTPLSESAFVGAGIGAALGGMRPVVEIMTVNFSLLALDQILNNAATLRHMSGGQFGVPLVIRMTTGAGRQLAAQHSHSLEGWYAHIPGLRVVTPATLVDARGMLWTALADPDRLATDGIEAEVLDLRTLRPLDTPKACCATPTQPCTSPRHAAGGGGSLPTNPCTRPRSAPRLAVNVSRRQLDHRGINAQITQALDASGLPADRLFLEVTESQLLAADTSSTSDLRTLADSGIRIAVDDFGTGYAGFDYLRRLPVHELKIDRSFIDGTDPTDTAITAITASVVALGLRLGLTVVAEGIETTEQLHTLREMGCTWGQGWLWHPALPADGIDALLASRRAGAVCCVFRPRRPVPHGATARLGVARNSPSTGRVGCSSMATFDPGLGGGSRLGWQEGRIRGRLRWCPKNRLRRTDPLRCGSGETIWPTGGCSLIGRTPDGALPGAWITSVARTSLWPGCHAGAS